MPVIDTGLLSKDIRSEFLQRYRERDEAGLWKKIATPLKSDKEAETYKWLGSVPRMRRFGAARVAKGLRTESYSVENETYEATIEVDRTEIADDQTGQIMIRVGELATVAAEHKDYLIALLLMNGGSAGYVSYDGVTFFNTQHESGDSGQQDNALTHNFTSATDWTTAECKEVIKGSLAKMMTYKDDNGKPMPGFSQGGYMFVTPPNLYWNMKEALTAAHIGDTSNILIGSADLFPYPWLTDQDRVYLIKTGAAVGPFVFQDREPMEVDSVEKGSEHAFTSDKYQYGVRARYAMSYGYWQYAIRIVGT